MISPYYNSAPKNITPRVRGGGGGQKYSLRGYKWYPIIPIGTMLINDAETLDCRRVLNRVDFNQADGPGNCNEWCHPYAWSTCVCTALNPPVQERNPPRQRAIATELDLLLMIHGLYGLDSC